MRQKNGRWREGVGAGGGVDEEEVWRGQEGEVGGTEVR